MMEPINFCYWLRGFLEIQKPGEITEEQIKEINKHLDLVLYPVTTIVIPPQQTLKYDFPPSDGINKDIPVTIVWQNEASC